MASSDDPRTGQADRASRRLEILRGSDIIEWDATEGRRVYGRVIPSEPEMRNTVFCAKPIGVVARVFAMETSR